VQHKLVYDFSEGNKDLKDLLGGKGANLAEMTNLGLPVPSGFTITTEACQVYLSTGTLPPGLADEVTEHLRVLEKTVGKTLGDPAERSSRSFSSVRGRAVVRMVSSRRVASGS